MNIPSPIALTADSSDGINVEAIPDELKDLDQWVIWRYETRKGQDKATKVPYNPQRPQSRASSTDPDTWSPFAVALACYERGEAYGIGFVFSEDDPYAGIDLDGFDPADVHPWIIGCLRLLDSYTELSPSVTGTHTIVRGSVPGPRNRKGRIEMYDRARYFTFTGWHVATSPPTIEARQDELDALYAEVFPEEVSAPLAVNVLAGDAILEMALAARNGDKFERLFHRGDTTGYTSQSEADLALANLLVYWCEGDAGLADHFFRQSALMRAKWDERRGEQTYGERTLGAALRTYTPPVAKRTNGVAEPLDYQAAPAYQAPPEPIYYRESESNSVRINHAHLVAFLEHAGFGKLYLTGARESILVRVEGKIAEEVSGEQIKDFVLDYVGAHPDVDSGDRKAVRACLIRGANAYFSKYLLTCMAPLDLTFQRDTRKTGYVYYENGYVEVRAEGITFHDYNLLDGCVWREEIQPRRLCLIPAFDSSTVGEGDFSKFLWHVCRSADVETQQQRFLALFTTIGYLLHSYKDPSQARAVCFLDEKIGEGDALEGRCGKGLVLRAVGHVVPTLHIDARSFRFGEQFSFQQVRPGTRVIHFDDASRRFPFERLYSMITGDMQTEQKNRDQRTIPFALSPKFALSTNFVVEGEGGSHEDRIVEVEFSDYYNARHKPVDDFGRRFFDEWDSQEWNHFDNLMLAALRAYLAQGLTGYTHVNLAARKLRQKTAPEFLVWAEELDVGKLHNKKELYQDFTLQYPDFREGKSKIEQRTLTAWLKLYAASFNLDVVESRSGSGSERYLTLIKPDIE